MRANNHLHRAGIWLGLLLLLAPLGAVGQVASTVFGRVKDSVFVVKAFDANGTPIALGSAVLLPSGKFATNYHVVKDGASYQVGRSERFVAATYFAGDSDKDICLLDAPGLTGKPSLLGKAAGLKVGQPVYAVGAPQGLELSISEGIVSQLRGAPPPMIQTTAAISPGSSGGGLFDAEGRLVGLIVLYIESGQNLNFALPVEWIADVKPGNERLPGERTGSAWLDRGSQLLTENNWPDLRDLCLTWTKREPKSADAWYLLGMAQQHLSRNTEAADAFRQALQINPEYPTAWDNLGFSCMLLHRYTDAIEAYRQAVRITPESASAWSTLGLVYFNQSQLNEAEAQGATKEKAYWIRLANIFTYNNAIEALHQALRIDPENASAWGNLGVSYRRINRYDDAVDAYRQYLRIRPNDADGWYNLGVAYGDLNRYPEAIEAHRHSLSINPENSQAWFALGLGYALAGNKSAALDVVKSLRRLDPNKADELFNLIVPR